MKTLFKVYLKILNHFIHIHISWKIFYRNWLLACSHLNFYLNHFWMNFKSFSKLTFCPPLTHLNLIQIWFKTHLNFIHIRFVWNFGQLTDSIWIIFKIHLWQICIEFKWILNIHFKPSNNNFCIHLNFIQFLGLILMAKYRLWCFM